MNVGLIHRVTIYRDDATGGDDEWGLPAVASAAVATDVPALVQPRSSREQPRPSGVAVVDALIFLPAGTNVRDSDMIFHDATAYRVVGAAVDAGGAGHHLEVAAVRVAADG